MKPAILRLLALMSAAVALSCLPCLAQDAPNYSSWYAYGGDAGGTRYSPLREITTENVAHLDTAWTYRTGELGGGSPVAEKLTFEATPVFLDGVLYFSTAFSDVIAVDATTGRELWRFEARVDRTLNYSELVSRGVSLWLTEEAHLGADCEKRVLVGTIDARLVVLDALTGEPCDDFGDAGEIDLAEGHRRHANPQYVDYQVTSPPAVIGDLVVVGSSIGDNWHADTGSGAVRGFDVRTGELRWTWNPLEPGERKAGAANAWSIISADPTRDLVFVPTGSPSPDFYGGLRRGDNRHANSVVALRGSTGEVVWSFQTVHHDLWDYDVAAQPALVTVSREDRAIPAVAQATKMGSLFLLDRETGEPLFPVEERPVPQSNVAGEGTSPTQPFPTLPRPVMPQDRLDPDDAWGITEADREECRGLLESHDNRGIFTPPSLRGTVMYPGNGSGTNWGSTAFHPERELLLLTTSRLATFVQLIPRDSLEAERARATATGQNIEFGSQRETPFAMKRRTLVSSSGMPCNPPPWGTLAAVDVASGNVHWEVPIGEHNGQIVGLPNGGGPIITASGLVFLASTMDEKFRAFDLENGEVLWSTDLPYSGIATPMTYEVADTQYVVIAAGGHGKMGLPTGDYLVAFALP